MTGTIWIRTGRPIRRASRLCRIAPGMNSISDHNTDVWVIPAAGGSLTKISDT